MRSSLEALLATGRVVLADGATGTNYFAMGLESGEPPELWNVEHPERVQELHRAFVDAGSDIILTNTFGGNRHRLKLDRAQDRVIELNQRAAELAREVSGPSGGGEVTVSTFSGGEANETTDTFTNKVAVAAGAPERIT